MLIDTIFLPIFGFLLIIMGSGFLFIIEKLVGIEVKSLPLYFFLVSGLFIIGMVSLLVNFFLPVNHIFTYILLLIVSFPSIFIIRNILKNNKNEILLMILLLLLSTPKVIFLQEGYDGGLYHLPHQLLLRTEKIIIGIVNLHGRLGFSSMLEYISSPLWLGNQDFRILTYVYFIFLSILFLFLYYLWNQNNSFFKFISLIMVVSILFRGVYFPWAYTSTDLPAGILFAIAFMKGWILLLNDDVSQKNPLFEFLFLSFFAVIMKLSSIILILWVLIVTLFLTYHNCKKIVAFFKYNAFLLLPLLFWLIKNLINTGCLLYPVEASCIGLEWSNPEQAMNESISVIAWARSPGPNYLKSLEGWEWIKPWYISNAHKFLIFGLAIVVTVIITMLLLRYQNSKYNESENLKTFYLKNSFALLFLIYALSFWFLNAPDVRFAIGPFLILAAVINGFIVSRPMHILEKFPLSNVVILIVVTSFSIGLERIIKNPIKISNIELADIFYFPIRPGQTNFLQHPVFGYIPVDGEDRCFIVKHCYPGNRSKPQWIYGYMYVPRPLKK